MARRLKIKAIRRRAGNFATSVLRRIARDLQNPRVLIALTLTIAVYISYKENAEDNYITKLAAKISSSKADAAKKVANYISHHQLQTVGALAHCTSAYAAQSSSGTGTCLAGAIAAYLLPEQAQWDYAVHALLLYLYLVAKRPSWKVLVIALAIAAWLGDYYTIKTS